MRAPRNIYATADRSRVVDETDPDARVLLFGVNEEIPESEVKRLGIKEYLAALKGEHTGKEAKEAEKPAMAAAAEAPAPEPEAKAVEKADEGVEDKAVPGPKRAAKG